MIYPQNFESKEKIKEIIGEYNGYLSVLGTNDLKQEYLLRRGEFSSSPTIFNVRMYFKVKEKMLEKGFNLDTLEQEGNERSL